MSENCRLRVNCSTVFTPHYKGKYSSNGIQSEILADIYIYNWQHVSRWTENTGEKFFMCLVHFLRINKLERARSKVASVQNEILQIKGWKICLQEYLAVMESTPTKRSHVIPPTLNVSSPARKCGKHLLFPNKRKPSDDKNKKTSRITNKDNFLQQTVAGDIVLQK